MYRTLSDGSISKYDGMPGRAYGTPVKYRVPQKSLRTLGKMLSGLDTILKFIECSKC